jgi:hypothetical protein
MAKFKKFRRLGFSEMRPVVDREINLGADYLRDNDIMVSKVDEKEGSPEEGDMIARNPEDHRDQWLVAKKYFEENFEEIN